MDYPKNIVEEASAFVFELFKSKLSHEYVYHNYQHTQETVEVCRILAKAYPELTPEEHEDLMLAAWFHDTGYIKAYKGHEDKSKEYAKEFLEAKKFTDKRIERILYCIDATKREQKTDTLISQILSDADIINIGEVSFFAKSSLLKKEWENFGIWKCSKIDWANTQLNFLQSATFHTQEAQRLYGQQLQRNIQEQTKALKRIQKKQKKKLKAQQKIKAQPKRGIETMFRSIYKSHINLSSIADSKANMMISINSLLISITLTLVGAKLSLLGTSFKQNQIVIYPVISLLLTSLGAIIFAILSAKPKVTRKIHNMQDVNASSVSILFFGTYTWFHVEEFENQMKELMKNEDALYGNMIRDLYYLGKVLIIKYRLIRISYLIFMIGLIITVLITIWVVIYLKQTHEYKNLLY